MTKDKLCLNSYQDKSKCYTYFYSVFNDIRYYLNNYMDNGFLDENDEIHKIVKEIDDPIIRHTALYLVENYCASKIYFSNDGTWKNNYACDALNKWLDNKKSYFTHALHCKGNVHLWDKTIETLWKRLEEESKKNNNNKWCKNNNNKWCKRNNYFRGHLKLPDELNPPRCYKHVPKGYQCVLPFPPNMCNLENTCTNKDYDIKTYYNKCKELKINGFTDFTKMFERTIANGDSLFKSIEDITFSRQVQSHSCPSLEYATPISFTPFGSKFSYRGLNKKRLRNNFKEELEYEEYARSINKNSHLGRRRNNIYYDSAKN